MLSYLAPDDLPAPDTLVDYGESGVSAAMFHYTSEHCDFRAIARANGFKAAVTQLTERSLIQRYEDGENILGEWRPKPPDGWQLGGVFDSDEGAFAIFLRKEQDTTEEVEADD